MLKFTPGLLTITYSSRKLLIFESEDIESVDDPDQVVFSESQTTEDSYIVLEDRQTKIELALPDVTPVVNGVLETLEAAVTSIAEPVKQAWSTVISQAVSLMMPKTGLMV